MTKLFIDDLRMPSAPDWAMVRSCDEAIAFIAQNGCPNEISFDYYLSHGQTVMPFIDWLIAEDKKSGGKLIPPNFKYDSHSSSESGSFLIMMTLDSYLACR